ncbi:MAG: hypothetical protein DM484_15310 [Candidatus Methylumidiphilus alinenensis]|uniref:Uncharacterized protein n=1 Tax=Candidatus Methylumidiphilus alinenensis TaxID=2202197 RepID=A0A2W4QYI5_9GAMM|nr:MAG: hypothetical protein DM484_15310 [Candidatus Methylumidiphilus alinenensis]
MTWLEPISTAVTAAELAQTLAGSASSVRRIATRIWNLIQNGRIVIPVFGAGGAGKSTIARLMSGTDPLDVALAYDESWQIERQQLPGTIPGQILVAPGQLERIDRSWPLLIEEISAGRAPLILNIVSFGLHSFSIPSYTELDVYTSGQTPAQFMTVYSSSRRAIEFKLFADLLSALRHVNHPLCIVTVVNKQDLWWNERRNVREYYSSGNYGKCLAEFVSEVGGRGIQHEFIPISSVVTNLTTQNNEILASTCAGYDQAIHLRHLHALFNKMEAVMQEAIH